NRQTRNYVTLAYSKIVDVSALTALTAGRRIDGTNDPSSRDLYILVAYATQNFLTFKSAL
ncbi:MAG: hypothetical protein PVH44_08465, partial [Desulfobacterales bacterium]